MLIAVLLSLTAYSQTLQKNYQDSLKKTVFHINIISPGFSIEHELSYSNTIVFDGSVSMLILYDSLNSSFHYFFYPQLKGEYRHYYNFNRRLREGKDINRFSGSYVGLMIQHMFGDKKQATYDRAGVVWGTQYVSRKKLCIGISIGFGYNVVQDVRIAPYFGMLGDLKLGFALP